MHTDASGVPTAERGCALYVRGRALHLAGGADAEECLTKAVRERPSTRLCCAWRGG
jgi:hypothetical protein